MLSRFFSLLRKRLSSNRVNESLIIPLDADQQQRRILERVAPFTMTTADRLLALIDAARYVHRLQIPGAFVECGVWRGGSSMAAALTLLDCGCNTREFYLYDTYEGMTAPSDIDVSHDGVSAAEQLQTTPRGSGVWCEASETEVRNNMLATGWPSPLIHLIKGPVEQTIPTVTPGRIAILRLDTDWYESTRHELTHLFPLLSHGGVLIIDDYGHWKGSRRATDEFLAGHPDFFLHRVDYTCRLLIKR
jgi:hypothetical protein